MDIGPLIDIWFLYNAHTANREYEDMHTPMKYISFWDVYCISLCIIYFLLLFINWSSIWKVTASWKSWQIVYNKQIHYSKKKSYWKLVNLKYPFLQLNNELCSFIKLPFHYNISIFTSLHILLFCWDYLSLKYDLIVTSVTYSINKISSLFFLFGLQVLNVFFDKGSFTFSRKH